MTPTLILTIGTIAFMAWWWWAERRWKKEKEAENE